MTALTPPQAVPAALRLQVRRAARLSGALAQLVASGDSGDAGFFWLLGRADEVRAVVGSTMGEWQEGRLDPERAAERIDVYVRGLEESLQAFFSDTRPPPATGVRFRPPSDTLIDAQYVDAEVSSG